LGFPQNRKGVEMQEAKSRIKINRLLEEAGWMISASTGQYEDS
jgi:hypothetical protein